MNSYQVGVSAEAFAAAVFAQAECDVSVQYGANQPGYDLIVAKGNKLLKISVKGSQDGSWIAAGSMKKKGISYFQALKNWHKKHKHNIIFCFVQFKSIPYGKIPRIYIASLDEVVEHLSTTRGGKINLILHEYHKYVRGIGAGHVDVIPESWKLSEKRIEKIFNKFG